MLKNKLLSWINLFIMVLYTIPVTYSIWLVGLFSKYGSLKYHIAQSWVNPWLWAARAKTTFSKAVEYKNNESYVVISNHLSNCLLYTSPSPRDFEASRMPSSA